MIFQPKPGLYSLVHQLDFTSLYPSIIVNYNLSPETFDGTDQSGFHSRRSPASFGATQGDEASERHRLEVQGFDSILKWMLVTRFGYTGYRNAKFGSIQVHEQITAISRKILIQVE